MHFGAFDILFHFRYESASILISAHFDSATLPLRSCAYPRIESIIEWISEAIEISAGAILIA